jgi:hypothetical protein
MSARAHTMIALAASLALLPSIAAAQDARPEPVQSEILVVLASETEGTIDPALSGVPALRRPPFNAFHTMQVLSRADRALTPGTPVELALPNGRQLRIELEQRLADGRYRVRFSINTPGQTDYLPRVLVDLSPGELFFFGGQNHQVGSLAGTLVIGVRIGQRPATRKAA